MIEEKGSNRFDKNEDGNYETALKEAEFLVSDYMKSIEKPKTVTPGMKQMCIQYKKLKLCSILLGITTLIGVIISIVK